MVCFQAVSIYAFILCSYLFFRVILLERRWVSLPDLWARRDPAGWILKFNIRQSLKCHLAGVTLSCHFHALRMVWSMSVPAFHPSTSLAFVGSAQIFSMSPLRRGPMVYGTFTPVARSKDCMSCITLSPRPVPRLNISKGRCHFCRACGALQ